MTQESFYSGKTQIYWTCDALLKGREISHALEIKEVSGWRLGAIIHRLKYDYGWPIIPEYRGPSNVAYYRLKPDTDRAKLRFPPSAKALSNGEGV